MRHRGKEPASRRDRCANRARETRRPTSRSSRRHLSGRLRVPSNITLIPLPAKRPNSTRRKASDSSSATTGSPIGSSNPTTTSSTIATRPGTSSSTNPENHVHRNARLGLPVIITETWY
jgi:hypothetical protein